MNHSLVHLDIGSNDITFEGANLLFNALEKHPTLSSLTLANHDRLHRNRIGPKACYEIKNFIENNKIISMLNISDNGITNEGLRILSPALTNESNLISINLANNDLSGQ
jgi:Ran GTPase-activating protein (RanGAP) involved in mRNA processing and transport